MKKFDRHYTVIIPTLNAASTIQRQLESLLTQTVPPETVLVVDSRSDDGTVKLARSVGGVKVIEICRSEYDHGGTRDLAVRSTGTPFVVILTQDALPVDNQWAEKMMEPFEAEDIAAVCGRQIAWPDARASERAFRAFRYPDHSRSWDITDVPSMGMNAFLISNVCAAYRRSAYDAVGGFVHPILTNEDMLMAAQLLEGGYRLSYSAEARVWHSHNNTLRQEYLRNRLIGEFLAQYGRYFQNAGEMGEGVKLAKYVTGELFAQGKIAEVLPFWMNCAARLLGNRIGRLRQTEKGKRK